MFNPPGAARVTYESYLAAWRDLFGDDKAANVTVVTLPTVTIGVITLVLLDREDFELFDLMDIERCVLSPKKEIPRTGPAQERLPFDEPIFDLDYEETGS